MLFHCAAALSRLPLRVHYWLADYVMYPLMYYIVRYRRRMVTKNLRLSFPDKTEAERKQIARDFYHQLCYTFVETIYGYTCSNEEVKRRVVFANAEAVDEAAKTYGGCVVMLAHVGNWEWMASCQLWFSPEVTELNVYRKAKRESMDKFLHDLRAQRGGALVEKQRVLREMVRFRSEKKPIVLGLVADQKPRPEVTRTWLEFLHQDTGFLDGGEMLSKKFGYPVFALTVHRPERGMYQARFEMLSMDPKNSPEGEITTAYARNLEKNILAEPHLWLWTHNRWKWSRSNSAEI